MTFVGHLGEGNAQNGLGYLEAYDTKTGAQLWKSGLMDAPAAAAPVTYTVGGKQYVSIAVGGQSPQRRLAAARPDESGPVARRQHLHVRAAVTS